VLGFRCIECVNHSSIASRTNLNTVGSIRNRRHTFPQKHAVQQGLFCSTDIRSILLLVGGIRSCKQTFPQGILRCMFTQTCCITVV
jgi:hypothetical protein